MNYESANLWKKAIAYSNVISLYLRVRTEEDHVIIMSKTKTIN